MNFLNQLKSEATALQSRQNADVALLEANRSRTELGCKTAWLYIADLVKQLNVIEPDGPRLSVDSKTFWPALKLCGFRADFRKKMLRDMEVFDYIALGWDIVVREGTAPSGTISVNFPPRPQGARQSRWMVAAWPSSGTARVGCPGRWSRRSSPLCGLSSYRGRGPACR